MSPFPSRLLGDDEHIVLDLHPHWKRIVLPALLLPVVVGLASYLVFLVPDGSLHAALRWLILVVAVLVLLRWSLWPFLRWSTTRYVLTNRRVVIRTGVLSRSGRDIPLTRVNDVSFRHSVIDRMLRCGTLTIESAGEHGQVVLPEVPTVEMVQRQVLRHAEDESMRVARAADAQTS
ncbi:MAG TPA: PH domain-containing protein [Mycobacteriales bacterium]|nr:PH domain-containing protein [Mycobacteriales bacterium]